VTITPQPWRQNRLMAVVNRVTDTLPDQMVRDCPTLQAVLLQQVALLAHIAVAFQRLVHLKVITPTSEFQAIKAPFARLLRQRLHRLIAPLAREQCNWSWHGSTPYQLNCACLT